MPRLRAVATCFAFLSSRRFPTSRAVSRVARWKAAAIRALSVEMRARAWAESAAVMGRGGGAGGRAAWAVRAGASSGRWS